MGKLLLSSVLITNLVNPVFQTLDWSQLGSCGDGGSCGECTGQCGCSFCRLWWKYTLVKWVAIWNKDWWYTKEQSGRETERIALQHTHGTKTTGSTGMGPRSWLWGQGHDCGTIILAGRTQEALMIPSIGNTNNLDCGLTLDPVWLQFLDRILGYY